ncbi:MFS transporter [Variovorax robiniae]|uniref:MFS transporter n=1 Tax=Variovorax robiniae TaxID=1836199 RepID=A0ABU8XEH9_9BURK
MDSSIDDAEPARQPTLNRSDVKTLGLSALGGTLEYYDFVIYVFFASVIGKLFFPAHMSDGLRDLQTFGIFAAGYLARPVGGAIFGHFADRFGRKRMFTLSILLMACPTLLIACLPTYESIGMAAPVLLLLMRLLQGIAVGGELTGAWVFVGEHAPPRHYGFSLGVLTAGLNGGIVLGSIVAYVVHAMWSSAEVQDYAWRLPFALGGVFGMVSVYLRQFLGETPVFKAMQVQRKLTREMPVRTVLREHRGTLLYLGVQIWVLSAAIGVILLLTPVFLQKNYGISASEALSANVIATTAALIGCVVTGWATDRFGARLVMAVGWTGLLISSHVLYAGLPGTPQWVTLHYAMTGFFVGTVVIVPVVGVRAFPAAIRSSGLSFGYNIFYAVFGGLTPMLVSYLLRMDHMAPAHYVAVLCAVGALSAFLPMPGREERAPAMQLA